MGKERKSEEIAIGRISSLQLRLVELQIQNAQLRGQLLLLEDLVSKLDPEHSNHFQAGTRAYVKVKKKEGKEG